MRGIKYKCAKVFVQFYFSLLSSLFSQEKKRSTLLLNLVNSIFLPIKRDKMGTTVYSSCLFPWKNKQKIVTPHSVVANSSSLEKRGSRTKIGDVGSREKEVFEEENEGFNCGVLKRRTAIVKGVSLISSGVVLGVAEKGLAVVKQGLLAGRIPGLSEPDEQGWFSIYLIS